MEGKMMTRRRTFSFFHPSFLSKRRKNTLQHYNVSHFKLSNQLIDFHETRYATGGLSNATRLHFLVWAVKTWPTRKLVMRVRHLRHSLQDPTMRIYNNRR